MTYKTTKEKKGYVKKCLAALNKKYDMVSDAHLKGYVLCMVESNEIRQDESEELLGIIR